MSFCGKCDVAMEKRRLEAIEQFIFDLFRQKGTSRLLAKQIFNSSTDYSNADLVRAFEDLEKKWRLMVRYTKEGSDWIALTPKGAVHAGVEISEVGNPAMPHPPKSST